MSKTNMVQTANVDSICSIRAVIIKSYPIVNLYEGRVLYLLIIPSS